jgi:uncharacterized OsmC-like protein
VTKLTFALAATRVNESGSVVFSKDVQLQIDTSVAGRLDALNPVELLLAAQAACFIKGVERLAPSLNFEYSSVSVELSATRPETEARLEEINYRIEIGTSENDSRLELLHKNLMKFGTIYNTIKEGTRLTGVLERSLGA